MGLPLVPVHDLRQGNTTGLSMFPIHRILVAIKDTHSRHLGALHKAAQLARGLDAEVCLFHGIADPLYVDVPLDGESLPQMERQSREAHRARLERLAGRLTRHGVKVTTSVEWDFPSHEAVIRAAARFEADLIIAECHTKGHVAPWLLHFTDWELLRNSPIPVLLVKSPKPYRRPRILAAVDPGHAFDKPADLDGEILRYGATVAGALHGALHTVHAYNPMLIGMSATELIRPEAMAAAQAATAEKARAAVARVAKPIGVPAKRQHIEGGFAVDVIQHVASDVHAGILVMGAVSRSGLKRLLIGNMAERMLDRASCDVLIVKPRSFRNHIQRARRGVRYVAAPIMTGV
jgi:universal stress protein E